MNLPDEPRSVRVRHRRREQLVSHDRWLVSYADLMTLLFAFFVVLFATSQRTPGAFSKLSGAIHAGFLGGHAPVRGTRDEAAQRTIEIDRGHAGNPSPAAVLNLDDLAAQLQGVLGPSIASHQVSLNQTPDGLVISFEESGFFHSGEANLLSGQAVQIIAAAAILKQHKLALRVEGHSDDQPIHNAVFGSNWELSAARAMTVLLLLVDQAHYDPVQLSMAGYGPYRPAASNSTIEGRQKNRRVDLVVPRAGLPVAPEQPQAGDARLPTR